MTKKYLNLLDELYSKKLATIGFKDLVHKKEVNDGRTGIEGDVAGAGSPEEEQGLEGFYE